MNDIHIVNENGALVYLADQKPIVIFVDWSVDSPFRAALRAAAAPVRNRHADSISVTPTTAEGFAYSVSDKSTHLPPVVRLVVAELRLGRCPDPDFRALFGGWRPSSNYTIVSATVVQSDAITNGDRHHTALYLQAVGHRYVNVTDPKLVATLLSPSAKGCGYCGLSPSNGGA